MKRGLLLFAFVFSYGLAARVNGANATAVATPALSGTNAPVAKPQRTFVKEYKLGELAPLVTRNINRGRNFERGKQLFSEFSCLACHHFGPDGGGVGPDLTGVSGRYTPKDLLEEILDPSKSVSSLYASSNLRKKNGDVLTGRVTSEDDNEVGIMEDLLNPAKVSRRATCVESLRATRWVESR